MPLYEYYCRACAAKFELLRPMNRADEVATCPEGHRGSHRTLSVFATVARGASDALEATSGAGAGCACGGGGCGCGH